MAGFAKPTLLTAKRLRQILSYDPEAIDIVSRWRWLERKQGRSRRVGSITEEPPGTFRHRIMIDRIGYRANILAWLYMTGKWPSRDVDHENTNTLDDRWVNLRLATKSQSQWNQGKRRVNTSGFVGVSYEASRQKWRAMIKGKIIGRFDTPEEAAEVYRKAALDLYGEFAHGSLKNKPKPRVR